MVRNEVPLFRKLIDEHFGDRSKLILLVVNKVHSVRLMPKNPDPHAPAAQQNLRPGVVVDQQIVDPAWPEFFLNSHNTLLGTAKVPRYSILANDAGVGMDELQRTTLDLCFGHQIVNCPISKPTPSYVAEEYAKRGRSNLLARMNRSVFRLLFLHPPFVAAISCIKSPAATRTRRIERLSSRTNSDWTNTPIGTIG